MEDRLALLSTVDGSKTPPRTDTLAQLLAQVYRFFSPNTDDNETDDKEAERKTYTQMLKDKSVSRFANEFFSGFAQQ